MCTCKKGFRGPVHHVCCVNMVCIHATHVPYVCECVHTALHRTAAGEVVLRHCNSKEIALP